MAAMRKRNWVFTHNNYDISILPQIDNSDSRELLWLRYGQETGDKGTDHLQGCCQFRNQMRLNQVKEYFKKTMPGAHYEAMKGTIEQNITYTGKDATEENGLLHEFGVRPLSNEEKRQKGAGATKERYKVLIELARSGNFRKIEEDFPGDFLRMNRRLQELHREAVAKSNKTDILQGNKKQHWWIHGEAGSGKTSVVWDLYGDDLFLKDQNKWWDLYKGQKWTLIDDFNPEWTGSLKLKQWCDRYPFACEIKGGSTTLRPPHIVVTSNYKIDECNYREKDQPAIERRFQQCSAKQFREIHTMLKEKEETEKLELQAIQGIVNNMADMSDSQFNE